MDDSETSEKFKKILDFLKDDWEKEPQSTVMSFMIEKELSIKKTEADVLLNRLKERGFVKTPFKENDMFRVTDIGIRELETTYNPEYQKQLEKQREDQKEEEEKEQERQEGLEDTRHKDNLKWTKWGVIGALALGSIGAVTGIVSLIISINN